MKWINKEVVFGHNKIDEKDKKTFIDNLDKIESKYGFSFSGYKWDSSLREKVINNIIPEKTFLDMVIIYNDLMDK